MTNCKNCGAPLDGSGKCSYCGTRYKVERDFIRFEITRPGVHLLSAQAVISEDAMRAFSPQVCAEQAIKEMAQGFAAGIAQFMDVEHSYDPCTMSHQFRGRLRVVDREYRF